MISELVELIHGFLGDANRMRCFMHILNLVAKSILRQFDLPKGQTSDVLKVAEDGLALLGAQLEEYENEDWGDNTDDDVEDDDIEGWCDEHEEMSAEERDELEESIRPVKLVLVKVSPNEKFVLALTFVG